MNFFSRLSVRAKLTACFVLVAVIAAIIGAVGLTSINRMHSMAADMHGFELRGLYTVGRVDAEFRSAGRALRSAMLAPSDRRDQYEREMQQHFQAAEAAAREATEFFVTQEGQAEVQKLSGLLSDYRGSVEGVLKQVREGYYGALARATEVLVDEATPKANAAQAQVALLLERKLRNAESFAREIDSARQSAMILVLALTVIGALLAIFLGYILARTISRQLGGEPGEVAAIASSIAKGDLSIRIDTSAVQPNSVMANMAAMQAALRRLVGSVLNSSNNIASGASQIAAGNTDLSQRTEEQAANLTQTASAMEELAGTVQSNADVARQAAQRAMAASRSAANGGEVVENVVQTMAGITDSSKRIVDIISVIDSIAFQTNILALNAAVEAARAGEQGRGFAVVAGEVRSLAQKCAAAAKDIKSLIDDSVQKVEEGSRLVDTAGETMQGIVSEVKQVTDLISEISAATSEQTQGISQVNDAVLQLSDVTQQNAALVEESAAASASLNEQAQQLLDLVRVFRLESGQSQSQARSAAPQVISVPPATIEEGVRKTERPTPAGSRGHGSAAGARAPGSTAGAAAGNGTTAARRAPKVAAPASPVGERRAAPALGAARSAAATSGAATAPGSASASGAAPAAAARAGAAPRPGVAKPVYPATSKEDDWEEF